MTAIQADYKTHKHIPSRKQYQLIMEVPEEMFPKVCEVLGYPQTGGNTFVGIALLDIPEKHTDFHTANTPIFTPQEGDKTEGEKLAQRAGILCGDREFQRFLDSVSDPCKFPGVVGCSETAADILRYICGIKSRKELATNPEAQKKCRELFNKFDQWKTERRYKDNLERINT